MPSFTAMSFMDALASLQRCAVLQTLEPLAPCLSGATVYGGMPSLSNAFDPNPVFLVEMNRLALRDRFLLSTDARTFVRPMLMVSTESSPLADHLSGLHPEVASALRSRLRDRIEVRGSERTRNGIFQLALNRQDSFVLAFENERPFLWPYLNGPSLSEDDYRSGSASRNLLAGAFAALPEPTAQALLGAPDTQLYNVRF